MSNVESVNCVEELSCLLSEEEKLERSSRLARFYSQKMEVEEKKKAAMDEFKARLKKIDGDIHYLATILNAGKESRNVKCRLDYHWSEGNKILVRLDTGEVVREEVIDDCERQRHMEFVERENNKRIKETETQEWENESIEKTEDIQGQEDLADQAFNSAAELFDDLTKSAPSGDEDEAEPEDQGEFPLDGPEGGRVDDDPDEEEVDEDDTPQCFGTYDPSDESCDNCVDAEKCGEATPEEEPELSGDDPDMPPQYQCAQCKAYFDEPGESEEDDSTFCPECKDPNWM